MTTRNLLEAATLVESDTSAETWKVRLINEGRGSSGYYSADLLENYRHTFDGVLSYINHVEDPTTRNFMEIVGAVEGETWIETDEDGKVGIYANWRPDESYREKLARYSDRLGLSIFVSGDGEMREGVFHVTEFDATDPFRSVDVVIAAGRGGRFEISESLRESYESRRRGSENRPGARQAEQKKEITMDEELKEALKGITDALAVLVAEKKTAEAAEAQVEANEAAVTSAVEAYAANVKAIDDAELLDIQRDELLEAAKSGADLTDRIAKAKAVKEAALEAAGRITESAGARDFGNSTPTKFGAWS